jgi:hypothetical protein
MSDFAKFFKKIERISDEKRVLVNVLCERGGLISPIGPCKNNCQRQKQVPHRHPTTAGWVRDDNKRQNSRTVEHTRSEAASSSGHAGVREADPAWGRQAPHSKGVKADPSPKPRRDDNERQKPQI